MSRAEGVMDEAGESVELAEVEVLRHSGRALTCRIGNNRAMRIIAVPLRFLGRGSQVRHVGDSGKLVVPRWLAVSLGVA